MALYRERAGEIVNEGRGGYTVPGCSGGSYTVHLDVFGEGETCDCPDYTAPRRPAARGPEPQALPAAVAANLARMGA